MATISTAAKSSRSFAVSKPSAVHIEVYVRVVDDADIVETKWLCTQPAVRTIVVQDRHPWNQQVATESTAGSDRDAAWAVGVVGALAMMFGA